MMVRMWPDTTRGDLTEEVKRIFEELDRSVPDRQVTAVGSWTPAVDVVETETSVEIRCDLAGLSPESLRILIKGSSVLLAGEKRRPAQTGVRAFHLVERAFGRFARVVRPGTAFDARKVTAALEHGALTVTLPKLVDRRGEEFFVPVRLSDDRS